MPGGFGKGIFRNTKTPKDDVSNKGDLQGLVERR